MATIDLVDKMMPRVFGPSESHRQQCHNMSQMIAQQLTANTETVSASEVSRRKIRWFVAIGHTLYYSVKDESK